MGVSKSIQKGLIDLILLPPIIEVIVLRRVEIDDVIGMVEKVVTKDGKINGLKKYAGQTVVVIATQQRQ
jgi:hypothetical protein